MNFGNSLILVALIGSLSSFCCYMMMVFCKTRLQQYSRQFYVASSLCVLAASATLMTFMLTDRWDIKYVHDFNSISQPFLFKISGFWGGQEGSWLLWLTWISIVGLFLYRRAAHAEAPAMAFWTSLQTFFLLVLLQHSPFQPTVPAGMAGPTDGNGLTPLLQNYWMAIHPPVLFLGFTLMSVPAAFAIAALVQKDYTNWARMAFGWTMAGWTVLGTGILLGGFWAYEMLGWGGWWGWDPVENASLVPWLFAGALVHGMMLERIKGSWKAINLSIAMATFILVIYATYLTRSGILGDFSVHSFAALGNSWWLIGFILAYVALGVGLIAWRAKGIEQANLDDSISGKEFLVFLGMICFGLLGLLVAVGMSSPLITKWLSKPSNVPITYYYSVTTPVILLMLALIGFSPLVSWARSRTASGLSNNRWIISLCVALALGFFVSVYLWIVYDAEVASRVAIGWFSFAILVPSAWSLLETIKRKGLAMSGGFISHVGVSIFFLGMLAATHNNKAVPDKLELTEGRPVKKLGMTWNFRGMGQTSETGKKPFLIDITKPDGSTFTATPVIQDIRDGEMHHPFIRKSIAGDLYIAPVDVAILDGSPDFDMARGSTRKIGQWNVTFKGFAGMDMQPNHIQAGSVFEVWKDGQPKQRVVPVLHVMEGQLSPAPASIEGTADGIMVTNILVEKKAVRVNLVKMRGIVEVTFKPVVWCLWLGVLIIAFGGGVSSFRRIRDARKAAESASRVSASIPETSSHSPTNSLRKDAIPEV